MSSDTFIALDIPRLGTNSSRRIEEQAQARGHAAGYTDGLRAAQAEHAVRVAQYEAERAEAARVAAERVDRAVSLLSAAARALEQRTLPLLADAHGALAAAAADLAESILGVELADHERGARAAVDRALAGVDTRLVHSVRLNPDDLALLDDVWLRGDGLRHDGSIGGVTFSADPELQRGDAVTEFADGYLDARIETALERATIALLRENP
ncbi:FliH/SctL family protein [Glaciibacter sp. 2TAF33]|uniref:FliH/SctL family protein n=1 Tax=Glaciibacter sp. 2TAF33 TaxID=3233015 RepID=UPI003F8E3B50